MEKIKKDVFQFSKVRAITYWDLLTEKDFKPRFYLNKLLN